MPYTPAQRRLFHEIAENPDAARRHGTSQSEGRKLAEEADKLAREGREKKAAGVSSKALTGLQARSIILDDMHDRENASTQESRAQMKQIFYDTLVGRVDPQGVIDLEPVFKPRG